MRCRIWIGISLFCLGLFALGQSAKADTIDGITFTVLNPDLSGNPGETLTWMYTVANNETNGLDIIFAVINAPSGFTGAASDNPGAGVFDGFGPSGIISNGSSWIEGTLYAFKADPTLANSFNSGQFDLTVYLSDGSFLDLYENYSATISSVANVPEPGSLALLASGLLAGLLLMRRAGR